MHISDGILSGPVLAAGFGGAAVLAAATMRRMDMEEIPKVSVITAVFFVASLIHVPLGPSSVHLILNGLVGVVLGMRAFPAILLGIILQAILFGHGGVSVIGVNAVMMGGGGLLAYGVWQLRHHFSFARNEVIFGALAGGTGVAVSGLILALALLTTGKEFMATAGLVLTWHIPIIIIEAIVTGACAGFLARVKPQLLAGNRRERAVHGASMENAS
jgi:cobalt/nickel transport system permease protein